MTIGRCFALALTCAALSIHADSLRNWDRDDLLENPRYQSANGRFVLVVRRYPVVADFASVRVGNVVDFDAEAGFTLPNDGDQETETAALYEAGPRGRRLLSVMKIPEEAGSTVMISDSGDRVIVEGSSDWLSYGISTDPLLTIYDARGAVVRSLERSDVFTAGDLAVLTRNTNLLDMSLQADAEEGEIVVISVGKLATIRIRVTDGALVDPPRDLLPAPHVYASSTNEPPPPGRFDVASNDACSEGAARIASSQLVARASETPVPAFPIIAVKARIRGRVWVEVVVSETGEVLCARATYFPFGIRDAAVAAAKQWKFTPYEIGGHPVKVTSEILFHFVDVEPKDWEELQRHPPY